MQDHFVFVEGNVTGNGPLAAEAAVRLGFAPVMVTRDESEYPWLASLGVRAVRADTADPAAVVSALRRHEFPIAGITSTAEFFIPVAAQVAREFRLPGPDPAAVHRCRDKAQQRQAFATHKLRVPKFIRVETPDEAERAAALLGLPVVVKPVDGAGSINVALCVTLGDVRRQAEATLGQTRNIRGLPTARCLLVEEYLIGPEISVETLHGQVVAIVNKRLGELPRFVEIGHDVPAELSESDASAVAETVRRGLAALGLTWGVAHTELRLTAAGPVIVEVNPRMAGDHIPELVLLATGIDLPMESVLASAGDHRSPEPTRHRAASIRFAVIPDDGVLESVEGLESAQGIDGVEVAKVTAAAGRLMTVRGDFRDRVGYVIAQAENPERAIRAAERAAGGFRPRLVAVTPSSA